MPNINLHLGDCLEAMREMEDNQFDLAIVDPPYGIGRDNYEAGGKPSKSWKNPKKKVYKGNFDKSIPDPEYFDELFRVSNNQVIWGGNYFIDYLMPSMGVIAWDKKVNGNFSEFELAWTSFDQRARIFPFMWNGYRKQIPEERFHPTQKPVALYKWLLKNYAKTGDKILDTHAGSFSIGIACHDMGFDLEAWEIDEDYYNAAMKRFNNHIKQGSLFEPKELNQSTQKSIEWKH